MRREEPGRCARQGGPHVRQVGDPAALDPTKDTNITAAAAPIFTASDFSDSDVAKTATVMSWCSMASPAPAPSPWAATTTTTAPGQTGEMRNFKAGQMIGAVLEYAQRLKTPVMIYVFRTFPHSTGMVDSSVGGRGKLGCRATTPRWPRPSSGLQPRRRPPLRNGAAGQQIGYFSSMARGEHSSPRPLVTSWCRS